MNTQHAYHTTFASTDTVTAPGDVPPSALPLTNYILLTLVQLLAPWWLYKQQCFAMDFQTVRVCFALVEVLQRRRGYRRSGPLSRRAWQDLQALTGITSRKTLQRCIGDLRKRGILPQDPEDWTLFERVDQLYNCPEGLPQWLKTFRPNAPGGIQCQRAYGVPRELLKTLAQDPRVVMAVHLACILRCFGKDQWQRTVDPDTGALCIQGNGALAAAWVAQRFQVSERQVHRVLQTATQDGWMERFTAPWWYLRHRGAKTAVTLRGGGKTRRPQGNANVTPSETPMSPQIPPPSPLFRSRNLPSALKPQNPLQDLPCPLPPPLPLENGVCTEKGNVPELVNHVEPTRKPGIERDQGSPPPLPAHITPDDLRDPPWVDHWYHAACTQRMVSRCPANRLNVQIAAVHALQWPCDNPAGLFVATVQAHRWQVFTGAEEEDGRRRLRRVVEGADRPARAAPTVPDCLGAAHRVGNDVLRVVRGVQMGSERSAPPASSHAPGPAGQEPHDQAAGEQQWRRDFEHLREARRAHHCDGEGCAACALFEKQARLLECRWHRLQAHEATHTLSTPPLGSRDSPMPRSSPGPAGPEPHAQAVGQRAPSEACTMGQHTWKPWGERIIACAACEAHHQDCRCWGCHAEGEP